MEDIEWRFMDDDNADDDDVLLAFLLCDDDDLLMIQHYQHKRRGGSVPGRKPNLDRQHDQGYHRMRQDYFADNALYKDMFTRRFRISNAVFTKVMNHVLSTDMFFVRKKDALGVYGLYPEQKITAALRMLAYGIPADATDEYCRIGESTALESLKRFCDAVNKALGPQYLRAPTKAEIDEYVAANAERGFPGMFGSLDCTHWAWKNCPTAFQGHYSGKENTPTVVLEAVATQDCRIWHAFFGSPGSLNDINILERSHLVSDIVNGAYRCTPYSVAGEQYDTAYFLVDGIYPKWSVFVHTLSVPTTDAEREFAKSQEAARKDVERAFGILKGRFGIISRPCLLWSKMRMDAVMRACIILHNMMVEEREKAGSTIKSIPQVLETEIREISEMRHEDPIHEQVIPYNDLMRRELARPWDAFIKDYLAVKDVNKHRQLFAGLIATRDE